MKYLKKFQTNAQYQDYITDKTAHKPNVSYVTDDGEVFYTPLPTDYSKEYFTIEAVTSGTLKMTFDVSTGENNTYYSFDDGATWSRWSDIPVTPFQLSLNQGDKVLFKKAENDSTRPHITAGTAQINVYGNIMSWVYGDNFENQTSMRTYAFSGMFAGNTNLLSAENLVLPATTLTSSCYYNMFSGCTGLTTAPELPATTLADSCYYGMFNGCTSLTTAPKLPATTLANHCYREMFQGCTSLVTAPELPALNIGYNSCYKTMFKSCTSLNYIKAMFTTEPNSESNTANWVSGVSATGTFVKNANATWSSTGNNGIPSGWTVETATE